MNKTSYTARSLYRNRHAAVILLLTLICVPQVLIAGSSRVSVSSEMWARINSTPKFMKIAGLKELVEKLNSNESVVLDINYAGGETGQLWAQQFKNRLIALGIDGNRVSLVQGAVAINHLEISSRKMP